MDRDELIRRKDLAESKEWKDIKTLMLEEILRYSGNGSVYSSENIRGMLQVIKFPNEWIDECEKELKSENKK